MSRERRGRGPLRARRASALTRAATRQPAARRYPSDPKKALLVDEVVGLHDDVYGLIRPSIVVMRDPKLSKREATRRQTEMRKELAEEKLPAMFSHYESMLSSSGTGYFVGSTPTTADMAVFSQLRVLQSGIMDGIPVNLIDAFPKLKGARGPAGFQPARARPCAPCCPRPVANTPPPFSRARAHGRLQRSTTAWAPRPRSKSGTPTRSRGGTPGMRASDRPASATTRGPYAAEHWAHNAGGWTSTMLSAARTTRRE